MIFNNIKKENDFDHQKLERESQIDKFSPFLGQESTLSFSYYVMPLVTE